MYAGLGFPFNKGTYLWGIWRYRQLKQAERAVVPIAAIVGTAAGPAAQ